VSHLISPKKEKSVEREHSILIRMPEGKRRMEYVMPDTMLRRMAAWILLIVCATAAVGVRACGATTFRPTILVISSFHKDMPWQMSVEDGMDKVLDYRTSGATVYFEYMDALRFKTADTDDEFARLIARKYAGKAVDVVVAWAGPAAQFVARHPHMFTGDTFAGSRVIIAEVPGERTDELRRTIPNAMFLEVKADYITPIRTAVAVSGAREVALVGDTSDDTGRTRAANFQQAWPFAGQDIRLTSLLDLPLDRVVSQVARLPRDAIVYYMAVFHDETGQRIRPFDAAARIAAAASVPVFSQWELFFGSGIAGGYLLSGERIGESVGRLALAVSGQGAGDLPLAGDPPDIHRPDSQTPYIHMYDARQLARWSIPESRLPPGSLVMNRPPGLLEQYGWGLAVTGVVVGVLAAFSAVLLRVLVLRQRALGELAAERGQLATRVRERTAELAAKADELACSNRELESFAYAVSHDLRSPLRTVRSYTGLLVRSLGDRLSEDERELAGFVAQGAEKMDCMVRGLLDYSRTGRQDPARLGWVTVRGAIDDALKALSAAIEDSGARIVVDIPGDIPMLRAGPMAVERLVQNLVGNAIAYRHPDRPPDIRIEARLAADSGTVDLVVRDNGMGIAGEHHERIFGMFQRLHAGASAEGGYGIGLALCRRIMDVHRGHIRVESVPGEGSAFHATFPCPPSASTDAGPDIIPGAT
jgi:signal transduction histidine kinase